MTKIATDSQIRKIIHQIICEAVAIHFLFYKYCAPLVL